MTGRRASRPRTPQWSAALGLAVVALAVSGCAHMARTTTDTDLCTQYAAVVTAAQQFTAQKLAGAGPDELRKRAEAFQTQVDALAAVSGGRLDSQIDALQASLDDYRAAAVDAGAHAGTAAQPLVKDSLDDVKDSWAMLRDVAATECGSTGKA